MPLVFHPLTRGEIPDTLSHTTQANPLEIALLNLERALGGGESVGTTNRFPEKRKMRTINYKSNKTTPRDWNLIGVEIGEYIERDTSHNITFYSSLFLVGMSAGALLLVWAVYFFGR